ncbi:YceI family protein [Limobrevibacterium gyesilva]|uniref:YceI family protein n=1 Tax=Limobrevibacterium gyesilva TaxID=2991712 RepID=UPI002225C39E
MISLHACRARAARLGFLFLLATAVLPPGSVRAESAYSLDQRFGTIEFSVDHLGLFTSQGQFDKFDATLTIDAAHPEWTRIAVDVDAKSVDMSWQGAVAMLQSADYFDVQHYPDVRFVSATIEVLSADHYLIHGTVMIRGITQPCVLDARMTARHFDPARKAEVADFVVTGTLRRSAFGMIADRSFISDAVKLSIHARIQLAASGRAG